MTEKETDVSWALELLDGKSDPNQHAFPNAYLGFWGAFGCGAAVIVNLVNRKPLFSTIHNHILYTVLSMGAAKLINDKRETIFAERDALLRQYIISHPDDFPPPERKKWKDVLADWVPVR